jgi:hypothetical protein
MVTLPCRSRDRGWRGRSYIRRAHRPGPVFRVTGGRPSIVRAGPATPDGTQGRSALAPTADSVVGVSCLDHRGRVRGRRSPPDLVRGPVSRRQACHDWAGHPCCFPRAHRPVPRGGRRRAGHLACRPDLRDLLSAGARTRRRPVFPQDGIRAQLAAAHDWRRPRLRRAWLIGGGVPAGGARRRRSRCRRSPRAAVRARGPHG